MNAQQQSHEAKANPLAINAAQMALLEQCFRQQEEEDGTDGLDVDQFITVFGKVLGEDVINANRRPLHHLFMKVDANSDGSVDWEEFTNFLLLENQGQEIENGQASDILIRGSSQDSERMNFHRDMITSINHLPEHSKYTTVSRDGTVKVWDTTALSHKRTIINNKSWGVASAFLPMSKQLAVVSLDGVVNFYEPSAWQLKSQISHVPYFDEITGDSTKHKREEARWLIESAPVCVSATVLGDKDLLSVGTEKGKAYLYSLGSHWHICTGDQSKTPNQASIKTAMTKWQKMELHSLMNPYRNQIKDGYVQPVLSCTHTQPTREHVEPTQLDIHKDWITNIEYIDELQSLVTSSLDCEIRFSDIERRKKTRNYSGHSRGVYDFAFCKEYKFIASCGVERRVDIFDPHRCMRMTSLVGHSASISHVLCNDARHQIISLACDKVIKIWDTRTFRCLQTLHDTMSYQPENRISDVIFDNVHQRLVTCSNRLQLWPIESHVRQSFTSHDEPISAAMFNSNFQQVVSADSRGHFHVWDVETSLRVFRYSQEERVTSLRFDTSQRRLICGSDDGKLRIWNFSNGQCLTELRDIGHRCAHWKYDTNFGKIRSTEITGIIYVMEVSEWSPFDVQHWLETFRDRQIRRVCGNLIREGIDGRQLLQLSHEELQEKFGIEEEEPRRRLLHAITSLFSSNVAARYVVSVGWDGKIRVWVDGSKRIQHPLFVMPTQKDIEESQQGEISCISHFPPSFVVTGGSDGSLCVWNVLSGHFRCKIRCPQSKWEAHGDVSVTKVVWLHHLKLIVSTHADGVIVFWNLLVSTDESSILGWRQTAHFDFGGITTIASARHDHNLITADATGHIQVFELVWDTRDDFIETSGQERLNFNDVIPRSRGWRAHDACISSVDYLDTHELILTGGHDHKVLLWTWQGVLIGMFGQMGFDVNNEPIPTKWSLSDPETYEESRPRTIDLKDCVYLSPETESQKENQVQQRRGSIQMSVVSTTASKELFDPETGAAPELLAMLDKPIGIRTKRHKQSGKGINYQLKTFTLDDIPSESPFK